MSYAYAKEFNLKTIKFNKRFFQDFKTMITEDIYRIYSGKKYELTSINNTYTELNNNTHINIENKLNDLEEEYNAVLNAFEREVKFFQKNSLWIKFYRLDDITDKLKDKLEKHTMIDLPNKDYDEWFRYYEVFIKFNLIGNTNKTLKGLHLCDNVSSNALRYYNLINLKNLIKYDWKSSNRSNNRSNNKTNKDKFNIVVSECSDDIIKTFLLVFSLLMKNGNCVIKYKYPVLYKDLHLIYLCYNHFAKISFYKPVYANNLEFFIVCQKYNPISSSVLAKLKTNKYKPQLSNHFKVNIGNTIGKLTNNIIFELSNKIFYLRNDDDLPKQSNTFIQKVINKKNDEWFKLFLPINLKSKKKVSFFDITIFSDVFTEDKAIVKKFTKSKNNFNSNKSPSSKMFQKLTDRMDEIGFELDKFPGELYGKVAYHFEIFNKKFREQISSLYGYKVSQGGIKNE